MSKIFGYETPHGNLYLYGGNLHMCLPFLKDLCNSVEAICEKYKLY